MRSALCAGALSALLLASTPAAALAQPAASDGEAMFRATTLSLTAEGETKVTPDMATLNLGVTTQAATAAEAMQQNAAEMSRVMAALRRAGLEARDIRTAQVSINPQYAYQQGEAPRLSGYQATNQVIVTTRDLARLGPTLDAAVAAGANAAGGISFGLVDSTPAEDAARVAAVKALQAKADLYAKAAGYRILRLVSLSEGAGYANPPPVPMARMAVAEAVQTPISPGETRVRIEVTGTFELTR
jgi:uncharacterized protein YggE